MGNKSKDYIEMPKFLKKQDCKSFNTLFVKKEL